MSVSCVPRLNGFHWSTNIAEMQRLGSGVLVIIRQNYYLFFHIIINIVSISNDIYDVYLFWF